MDFIKKLLGLNNNSKKMEEQNDTEIEERLLNLVRKLETVKKTAYLPVTVAKDPEFNSISKFGGYPFLRNEDDWPVCPNCKNHMQLFLQLELDKLPEKKQEGLLQLFYCTNDEMYCESELEAFFPFSKGSVCRILNPEGDSAKIHPKIAKIYPEKIITDWIAKDDYPTYVEYDILDLDIDFEDDEVFDLLSERDLCQTLENDKLFGYPFWVQGEEYPFDRKTNSLMHLLFQLDSNDNLPYMFGDSGIGHLTQSPDNTHELAFGWACY